MGPVCLCVCLCVRVLEWTVVLPTVNPFFTDILAYFTVLILPFICPSVQSAFSRCTVLAMTWCNWWCQQLYMGVKFLVVGHRMAIFNISKPYLTVVGKMVYVIIWDYFRAISYSELQYFNDKCLTVWFPIHMLVISRQCQGQWPSKGADKGPHCGYSHCVGGW